MSETPRPAPRAPVASVIAWLVLGAALGLTIFSFRREQGLVKAEGGRRFERRAQVVNNSLLRKLEAYETVLRASASFGAEPDEPTPASWRRFVQHLDLARLYPAILAMEVAPLVDAQHVDAYRKRLRERGLGEFDIRPAGERSFYVPVDVVEPLEPNRAAIGLDLLSEPTRRAAVEGARDRDESVLSGPIRIVQDESNEERPAFLFVHPVFSGDPPTTTEEERRRLFRGVVVSVFRIDDVMREVLGEGARSDGWGLDVDIYDSDADGAGERLIYDGGVVGGDREARSQRQFEYASTIVAGGRRWRIDTSSLPVLEESARSHAPFALLVGGMALSVLLFAFVLRLSRSRGRAHARADKFQKTLSEREHFFESLLENVPDPVVRIDATGRYTYVNPAALQMTGTEVGFWLGRTSREIDMPEPIRELWSRTSESVLESGQEILVEFQTDLPAGARWYHSRVAPARGPGGGIDAVIVVSHDVTDRKDAERDQALAEKTRQKLEEQLRQSQKMEAIGRLSGGVAHDFNNLLTVILGNVALMQEDTGLTADAAELLGEIAASSERAANLTKQLLMFSRRQPIRLADIDLNDALEKMMRVIRRVLGEDIRITLRCSPRTLVVRADGGMLDQVLLNLAVNARDAMPNGGDLCIETSEVMIPESDALGRHGSARGGLHACLTVSDTGCGIAPGSLSQIFEPFYTTKDLGRGTGLGLSTVYGIVEQHGGFLEVSSEVEVGTKFMVFIPCFSPGDATAQAGEAHRAPIGGCETLLVVEDEMSVRDLAGKVLRRSGYQVLTASTGAEALAIHGAWRGRIDLVLTDIVMPGEINGFELARLLRVSSPTLPIVFTSGYSPDIASKNVELEEGRDFLPKPYDVDILVRTIRAALLRSSAAGSPSA